MGQLNILTDHFEFLLYPKKQNKLDIFKLKETTFITILKYYINNKQNVSENKILNLGSIKSDINIIFIFMYVQINIYLCL